MRVGGRLGFKLQASDLKHSIYVPRYYDPSIEDRLAELATTHELVRLGDLIGSGEVQLRQGNYVGKMHYGTGLIPYIRTSDIANWELRWSPKHGVSDAVYAQYAPQQDVREHDVLLVHEGTYLIGTPCLLTRYDTSILYQHHLAKLRVVKNDRLTGPLLMAALMAPVVQRQIRSTQYPADVIDSIVGRLPEVVLPLPASDAARKALSAKALQIFEGRAQARVRLAILARGLDRMLQDGDFARLTEEMDAGSAALDVTGLVSFLGERPEAHSFTVPSSQLRNGVLVPRYYDPRTSQDLVKLADSCDLVTIRELVQQGRLDLETGDEVGKLAYGSGSIPFVRTSDLGNWELKHDPKQRVSEDVYDEFAEGQSARAEDILLVRDGTYLVGSSSMVTEPDTPLLFSGGIYRLRVADPDDLDPYLLLALLNARVVKRQMRNKQFTRDVIDTLGRRFEEVALPLPKGGGLAAAIAQTMKELLGQRSKLRQAASQLGPEVETPVAP
jgi:hypothetical protein